MSSARSKGAMYRKNRSFLPAKTEEQNASKMKSFTVLPVAISSVNIRQKRKADFTVGNILSSNQYFERYGFPSSGPEEGRPCLPKYLLEDNIFPTVKSALLFCLIFSLIAD